MCVDSCQIPIFVSNENIDLTAQTEKGGFFPTVKSKASYLVKTYRVLHVMSDEPMNVHC